MFVGNDIRIYIALEFCASTKLTVDTTALVASSGVLVTLADVVRGIRKTWSGLMGHLD
jgi:hypothetical protein